MDLLNYTLYEKKIDNYKLLCSIKPPYMKSKYPYSHWTPEKIINTGKMIKLISADAKKKKGKRVKKLITNKKHNKIKEGGGSHKIWVF